MLANLRHLIRRQLCFDESSRGKGNPDQGIPIGVQFSASKIDDVAGRQSDFQSLNIFSCWTVLESSCAGSVRRDIAADKTTSFRRIRRIKQPFGLDRALQID